jgi:MarR family 2-MHQ and catechol resistance regulon transcriptional repressor
MRTRRPAPGPRYQALVQLLHTAETLWNASRVLFARWDLSPSVFNILYLLHEQPRGLTQVELSRQLLMHRSNVTGLIDRMETRGLVKRHDAPGDRRAYRVASSAGGARLMREILPVYYQVAEEVWGRLSLDRTNRLVDELTEVCARAERTASGMTPQTAAKEGA